MVLKWLPLWFFLLTIVQIWIFSSLVCDSYRGSTEFSTGSRHILQVTETTNQGKGHLRLPLLISVLKITNSFQFVVLAINVVFFIIS